MNKSLVLILLEHGHRMCRSVINYHAYDNVRCHDTCLLYQFLKNTLVWFKLGVWLQDHYSALGIFVLDYRSVKILFIVLSI